MDDKPIRRCSVHPNRSQMPTAMAMTITADNLPSRLKLDCNGGYDVAVKGLSVVVKSPSSQMHRSFDRNMETKNLRYVQFVGIGDVSYGTYAGPEYHCTLDFLRNSLQQAYH